MALGGEVRAEPSLLRPPQPHGGDGLPPDLGDARSADAVADRRADRSAGARGVRASQSAAAGPADALLPLLGSGRDAVALGEAPCRAQDDAAVPIPMGSGAAPPVEVKLKRCRNLRRTSVALPTLAPSASQQASKGEEGRATRLPPAPLR